MERVNVLFIGDPHVQIDNIPEVEMCIERLEKLALERKPDIIILAGDLLHTHERLHTTALNKAYELVNKMRRITKTYILVGNHDMCVAKNTPILLYDGTIKLSQYITANDVLIGDDGYPRYIKNLKSGTSEMYIVKQSNGESYTVSNNHILTLKQTYNKKLIWDGLKKCWTVKWLDCNSMKIRSKYFSLHRNILCKRLSREKAKMNAEKFLKNITVRTIVDIPIYDYINLPESIKSRLYGYKSKGVYWHRRDVLLEPYMMGLFLADPTNTGEKFSNSNTCIVNKWIEWCRKNGMYLIHTGDNNFSFSTLSSDGELESEKCTNLINKTIPENYLIFHEKDSLFNNLVESCNVTFQDINKNDTASYLTFYKNSLVKIIKYYNLHTKHIHNSYIITDYDSRLQLLAGFIDVSNVIKNEDGYLTLLCTDVNMSSQLLYVIGSVGLYGKYSLCDNQHKINISGNLSIIPSHTNKYTDMDINISLSVTKSEDSQYYGWEIDKNNRFLLGDFTVTHNCNNSQFLTSNHWMNGLKEWKNVVIVDKVISETIKGKNFIFAPYVSAGRFEEALNTLECDWKNVSCIFAHQEFFGCKMGAITSIDGDKWNIDYPNVISGHIHSRQQPQKNVYYPGSMLQHAFGESTKNIIACLTFNESPDYLLDEVDLGLPRKKIIYMDVENIDDYKITDTTDKIKITVSGSYEQFKALKKTKKYKKIIDDGIKIVFKPKKIELENQMEEKLTSDTSFSTILSELVNNQKDTYLFQTYELVVNNKTINQDDILYIN